MIRPRAAGDEDLRETAFRGKDRRSKNRAHSLLPVPWIGTRRVSRSAVVGRGVAFPVRMAVLL